MRKQIYRKNSFPNMYVWEDKICFKLYGYNSKQAMYDVYSNITGYVFGDIIVTKTNTGIFEFQCNFNEYLDMDRFFGQGFAVKDTHTGFGYIAKNLYDYTKLKYGKKFWGSE